MERVLAGLICDFDPEDVEWAHLRNLGPELLGEPVWELVKPARPDSWRELRHVVERRFGLSRKQLLDAFYAMRPHPGEAANAFLLRVEDMRLRYGVGEDTCERHFLHLLPLESRQEIDRLRAL